MRKIKKTLSVSEISCYDHDGVMQSVTVNGNVRTVERAVKELMKRGLYNVLVDDIKVRKYTYAMDAEQFFANAVLVDTGNEAEAEAEAEAETEAETETVNE
ncbi:MAG: hypothetical protein [Bacteriophage sp.]|nr:MAG: hypothetical protein [Bacteriophage sp.]